MTADSQVSYEARVRSRQAIIAGLAGALLAVGVVIQLGGAHSTINEQTIGLITANKRVARDVSSSIVQAVGYIASGVTLVWLFQITRVRSTQMRSPVIGIVAFAGCVLAGLSVAVYVIVYAAKAQDFVAHGSQTYEQANHLLSAPGLLVPQFANYLGVLMVAIGFVMVALNAMRVGLLTRFMGYLGVIAGVLAIFPLVPLPVVTIFWLLALAYLFSGRWPGGDPPAWRTGQAEPWPSSAEMREQRMKAASGERPAKPARGGTPEPERPTSSRTRASTPKRKRKRRR